MSAMDKRSLISESVAAIQIGVHSAREEPDQHIIHLPSRVSCMTTVHKVPIKLKLDPRSRDEVLTLSDRMARPSS
jgi:hypothetical protein